ncbi:uncharacterized protein JCM15063_004440 [Sporobolomyces koalae]|uniref:uncharacterized protein n=1 Tax=Sporobolomyces koalae TaxID=500713 RepID=UPI00317E82D1
MRFGLAPRSGGSNSDDSDSDSSRVAVPRARGPSRLHAPATPTFELPNLKKLSHRARSVLPLSDSEDSAPEDASDESDIDSEEEQWPVGPRGSIGLYGKLDRKGKGKAAAAVVVTASRVDQLDQWDDQSRAQSWANANRTFRLSLSRSVSATPAPTRSSTSASDVTQIDSLLSRLTMQHTQETQLLVTEFERRNQSLWERIESSIQLAEQEQRELEENRKRMQEQQRKAEEMRQAELARQDEERKRLEREECEAARLREEERARLEEEKRQAEARAAELEKKNSALVGKTTGEGSPRGEFEKWSTEINRIKEQVLPVVSQNPTLRKACFQAKRSITPKIGQLTSSRSAISRIITQLDELLRSVEASGSREAYVWTLNHLSKSVIKQAETEVTAKLGTAFPLGRVIIGLLLRGHTELGNVLMARLVKKCFWITGYWPSKQPGQSEESYQKTLGHANPNVGESNVQYAERMAGLVVLYGSILQCSPLEPPQALAPSTSSSPGTPLSHVPTWFRPSAGWRWLVLILRPPLVSLEPVPLLVTQFLQIAGPTLVETYGRQFNKFLEVLLREGLRDKKAGFNEKKSKASIVRLELWLEEWEQSGQTRVEPVPGKDCDE